MIKLANSNRLETKKCVNHITIETGCVDLGNIAFEMANYAWSIFNSIILQIKEEVV